MLGELVLGLFYQARLIVDGNVTTQEDAVDSCSGQRKCRPPLELAGEVAPLHGLAIPNLCDLEPLMLAISSHKSRPQGGSLSGAFL